MDKGREKMDKGQEKGKKRRPLSKRQQRLQDIARRQRWTPIRNLVLLALGALVVIGLGYLVIAPFFAPAPGQAAAIQGADHVERGESHPPYNTTPPTSGWHWADPARWGIHDKPIPDEQQIHNLEHGGILVQYDCPTGCSELVQQLEKIVQRYQFKLILAPYPNMEHRIALTAWGRIDAFDDFDEGRILRFIKAYCDKGPEQVPGESCR